MSEDTAHVTIALRLGVAGWQLGEENKKFFPADGTHLSRYATVFNAVEINSSFRSPHRRSTYERWKASVPEDFKFSVKAPKSITHTHRLADCEGELRAFLEAIEGLGEKRGPILFQLPPSFGFDGPLAARFFTLLRQHTDGAAVIEPRHPEWFTIEAAALLQQFGIPYVTADPPHGAPPPQARPPSLEYFRLHGSPRVYYSAYESGTLEGFASALQASLTKRECWCIFDNTAHGHAVPDALRLRASVIR